MTKHQAMHIEMGLTVAQPFVASFGVLFGAAAANQMMPTGLAVLAAFFVGAGAAISGLKAFMSNTFRDSQTAQGVGDGK
jgi:hypothetical protein